MSNSRTHAHTHTHAYASCLSYEYSEYSCESSLIFQFPLFSFIVEFSAFISIRFVGRRRQRKLDRSPSIRLYHRLKGWYLIMAVCVCVCLIGMPSLFSVDSSARQTRCRGWLDRRPEGEKIHKYSQLNSTMTPSTAIQQKPETIRSHYLFACFFFLRLLSLL